MDEAFNLKGEIYYADDNSGKVSTKFKKLRHDHHMKSTNHPFPLALKENAEQELERLQNMGIISPVQFFRYMGSSHSPRA